MTRPPTAFFRGAAARLPRHRSHQPHPCLSFPTSAGFRWGDPGHPHAAEWGRPPPPAAAVPTCPPSGRRAPSLAGRRGRRRRRRREEEAAGSGVARPGPAALGFVVRCRPRPCPGAARRTAARSRARRSLTGPGPATAGGNAGQVGRGRPAVGVIRGRGAGVRGAGVVVWS